MTSFKLKKMGTYAGIFVCQYLIIFIMHVYKSHEDQTRPRKAPKYVHQNIQYMVCSIHFHIVYFGDNDRAVSVVFCEAPGVRGRILKW